MPIVQDGIEKTEQEDQEPQEPQVELTDEEIMEAIRRAGEAKKARPRPDEVQHVQPIKPPQSVQPVKQAEPEDAYGEYERVQDDELVGWPAFKESLSHIPLRAILVGLALLILILAGYNSWKGGRNETISTTPTTVTAVAPAVATLAPAPASSCTWKTEMTTVASMDNGTICYANGFCFQADPGQLANMQVGQAVSYSACK